MSALPLPYYASSQRVERLAWQWPGLAQQTQDWIENISTWIMGLVTCLLGLSMRSFWCCGRYKIPCHHSPLPPPSQRVKAALSSPSCQAVGTEMGIAAAVDGDAAAVTAVAFSSCHHSARALQEQAVTQQSSFSALLSLSSCCPGTPLLLLCLLLTGV